MTLPLSSLHSSLSSNSFELNNPTMISNDHPNATIYHDDDVPFEIFDPRGLFSPQRLPTSSQNNNLAGLAINTSTTPIPNLTTTATHTATPHIASTLSSLENSLSPDFSLRPWSVRQNPSNFNQQDTAKSQDYCLAPSSTLFNPPSSTANSNELPDPPTSHDMSPVESPISPCSSLPYCRSPPTSLSMSHSLSLPRGRSPPARFSFDSLRAQLASPSSSPSPSPPRTSTSTDHTKSTQTLQNLPFSHPHRPSPIVTSGIRDLSLPSRLSHLCSADLPGSVSSLAYSDMDASPAVNFLSAFADATLPTVRTEMSPVATVPSEILQEGDQVSGYVLGSVIGRGGFSVVREARHLLRDQRVAVKIVKRSRNVCADSDLSLSRSSTIQPVSLHASISSRDRSSSVALSTNRHLVNSAHLPLPTSATEDLANALLKQEIQIWSNLRHHPNIVPLISLHETSSQTFLFMPMCEGGNLLQLLNQVKLNPAEQDTLYQDFNWTSPDSIPPSSPRQSDLPPSSGGLRLDLVRFIFLQIVQGLQYLHIEAGIVHKDIKLENILIQKGQVKISDFGLATYPFLERPVDVARPMKGKASSSWNRDLSLPKHFSALPRIAEGLVSGGNPRVVPWTQPNHSRTRPPPILDNSLFLSEPVNEDGEFHRFRQSPMNMFPTAAGSLAYTPPEQLRSEIPLACPSLDIWAVGCVLYGLLEGNLPFQDDFEPRLRLKIMNGQFEFPQALIVHPGHICETEADNRMMIAKVLKGCLAVDRNARWMIEEIASSAWLAPQRCQVSSTLSDDGLFSEDALEQPPIPRSSNSLTSSLPSAWSIDETSLKTFCNEGSLVDSNLEEVSSPSRSPFSDVSCTSPPLIRKDPSDLHKLLTCIPCYSSSSRSSVPINRQHDCRSPKSADLPPSPGSERIARPKHRGLSNHFRVSLPRVSVGSPPQQLHPRSRSKNRN